jgi:hypothetical protein
MALFVLFIVGAVLLGAGAMLAPALRTPQPRIGLAATLSLAWVMGGAVWFSYLLGWDNLFVDYLLFALVSGVVLGGTLSGAQARAEARGETLHDADQGWPGPGDLLFFAGVAGVLIVLVMTAGLPQGTTGVTLGYHTWLARLSSQFDTYAPYAPQAALFQPPGFIAITSYLSRQLEQPIPVVHFSFGAVLTLMTVWLAYDWGAEIGGKVRGRAYAMVCLLSGGTLAMLLTGQYTTLLGSLFGMAALMCLLRVLRERLWLDVIIAGLLIGAAVYADFVVGTAIVLACLAWGLTAWLRSPQRAYLGLRLGGVLLACGFGLFPWLLRLPGRGDATLYVEPLTIAGWLVIPAVLLGGELAYRLMLRLPAPTTAAARRHAYPLLMALAVAATLAAWGFGQTLRARLSISTNDLAALSWLRENASETTVVANTTIEDWASAYCECNALAAPAPASASARPELFFAPERAGAVPPADAAVVFRQGDAIIWR